MPFVFDDINYSAYHTVMRRPMPSSGPLALIATAGNEEMAEKISQHIHNIRQARATENPEKFLSQAGYLRSNYLIKSQCVRFSSGEGKAVVNDSVRGHDITILADITNHLIGYKVFGQDVPYSPDDHFQDIKRLILAMSGKANRIHIVMPYLYQAKQDNRISRESLDCAAALKELVQLGVNSIICFEPHEPRVENAIPEKGIENFPTSYLLIEKLLEDQNEIIFDPNHLAVISPDEGGMKRAVYYSSILGLQLSTFYRERDYTVSVNGRNPITSIRFLGEDVKGKDILIVDDMISSGQTMLQTARELKYKLGAKNIFCIATFPLMTNGLDPFNQAYEEGLIKKVYGTNLIKHSKALLEAPWYVQADASEQIAKILDATNHNLSTSGLMDESARINQLLDNRHQMDQFTQKKSY